jgi:uncharacterized protein (UPF0264 family)
VHRKQEAANLKLLISPKDAQEALEAVQGGADIVDVKNPNEGALGASFPWTITEIKRVLPKNVELSCTLGDIPNLPGTASLAARGAASLGVNYVKASLYNIKKKEEAIQMMKAIKRAVYDRNPEVKIVVAGFGDANRIGSLEPMAVPNIASAADCDVAMIDTAIKDGKTLLDFLNLQQIERFVDEGHKNGLKIAVAGSLGKIDLLTVCSQKVDIIGVRGAACTNGDRANGRISKEKVQKLKQLIPKT